MRARQRTGMHYKGIGKSNRSGSSGIKASKGLDHPIGFSGKTIGQLIARFHPGSASKTR